jgi:thiamine-phosphate pyrophosphorylase
MHRKAPTLLEDIRDAAAGREARLPRGLYVLTPEADGDRLENAVRAAIRGGATTVQYRNKTLDERQRLQQARRLRAACHDAGAIFIVNDSLELARESGADGVHLGRHDIDPHAARTALGPQAIIGVSCYDSFELALQTREVADYCAFGSVFPSRVKPAAVRAPLELFRLASEAGLHAVAIGGIDVENAGKVAGAGAAAVAVITAVFGPASVLADDVRIEANARAILSAFASRHGN